MSTFVAGFFVGVAATAAVAAVLVRAADLRSNSAAILPGTDASDAPIDTRHFRLAHGLGKDHPVHLGLERFAEIVEERSGGLLTVQVFPNAELGDETTSLEQLQSGTLEMAKASAAPLGAFSSDFAIFAVPYVFNDRAHYWRVLDGAIGEEILASLAGDGLIGLSYLDAGARSFYKSGEPIRSVGDVAGLKVRVMESQTAMDMISAFGGSPTPMSFSELYSSLQSGLVDAAENNPPSYLSSRHYEVADSYTLNEHARVPDVLLMSRRVWESLSPASRALIKEAAAEASAHQREIWADRTTRALDELEKYGVQVAEDFDRASFVESVRPLHESYDGTPLGDLLERIKRAD